MVSGCCGCSLLDLLPTCINKHDSYRLCCSYNHDDRDDHDEHDEDSRGRVAAADADDDSPRDRNTDVSCDDASGDDNVVIILTVRSSSG